MYTVHKITNGNGDTKGWAVIRHHREIVREFADLSSACMWADKANLGFDFL